MEVPQTHLSTLLCGSYQPRMVQSNPNFPNNPLKINDLNKLIFSYLDPISLSLASRVCKIWHRIASDSELWTAFIRRHQLWSDGNLKKNVLQQFGIERAYVITKDKNHLFTQILAYFAQQHWNQAASFSCRLGPKSDDRIFLCVKRNPLFPAGDHFTPLESLNTRFFSDVGPAQPDPLPVPVVNLNTFSREHAQAWGLQEYFVSIPCPLENHSGVYEAQILMPHSVASIYLAPLKTLVDNQLEKLAREEKTLKAKERLMRACVIGYVLEEKGMYGNMSASYPLSRLNGMAARVSVSL